MIGFAVDVLICLFGRRAAFEELCFVHAPVAVPSFTRGTALSFDPVGSQPMTGIRVVRPLQLLTRFRELRRFATQSLCIQYEYSSCTLTTFL